MQHFFQPTGLNNLSVKFFGSQIKKMVSRYGKSIYLDNHWDRQFSYRNSFVLNVDDDIKINCHKNSYISRLLFEGNFERQEISFIKQFLRASDTFIDIGANIGYHSLVAAYRLNGESGRVYSFEPTPKTFEWLAENVRINNFENIVPIAKAFSDKPGVFSFYQYLNGKDAYNSFGNILSNSMHIEIKVETTTLDEFMYSGEIDDSNISLIKIDVEGWEYPVLKGGAEYLSQKNAPVLMIEFNDSNARKAGFSCQKIYDLGRELGYEWVEIIEDEVIPSRKKSFYEYQNLYATKNIEFIRQRLLNP